jgi:hypothetical protein
MTKKIIFHKINNNFFKRSQKRRNNIGNITGMNKICFHYFPEFSKLYLIVANKKYNDF